MASQGNSADTASDSTTQANTDETLRPFHDASAKFFQASMAARDAVFKQRAQAYLDVQDKVREVEQEAQRALAEATRKHVDQIGQQGAGSLEEQHTARAQAQVDYEKDVRQIYADTQAKLKDVAGASAAADGGDAIGQLLRQRQDAYQTYLIDLQQAWSGAKSLDPQTVHAIASSILLTINSG